MQNLVHYLRRQKKLLALLILTMLWLSLFPAWVHRVTAKPLDDAITLSPSGTINREIEVAIPEHYEINLVFERASLPFQELKTLLGDWAYRDGQPIPSGVRVPVRWSLKKLHDGSIAASGENDTFGAIAWSAAEVDRKVGGFRVKPGRYLFNAQVLHDVPALAHIGTRLSINLPSKASSTWQMTLVWWGSIASYIVVWPAAAVIAMLLILQAGRSFFSARAART